MTVASARIPDLGGYYYILHDLRSLIQHAIDLLKRFASALVDSYLTEARRFRR